MKPDIYKVKTLGSGFLAIMAKPVSGEYIEDEFIGIANEGINQIVSLLESHEEYSVGLRREEELTHANGMVFRSYPIPDRGLPSSLVDFSNFIDNLYTQIHNGINTVVHCRAGIGRAGIVVASVLIRSGMKPEEAFELVVRQRGTSVPDTEEQRQWVVSNWNTISSTTYL